jgi:hypothetical protein
MKFSTFLTKFEDILLGGELDRYFSPAKPVPPLFFEQYVRDLEHGFFHGLVACYMHCLIRGDPDFQTIASLLLHDFLKCNNYSQELHDKMLCTYYPNLLHETYSHSNPPKEHEHSHVIVCDRLELRRYSDYATWVDDKFHDIFKQLDKETVNVIDDFYTNVRPVATQEYQLALLLADNSFSVLIDLIVAKLSHTNIVAS